MNEESALKSNESELPLPQDHPLTGYESELDALCECGRLFHRRGWSVGTSSNYSFVIETNPVQLAVTASGEDKGQLCRRDFVRLDEAGAPTASGQPRSSAETLLHVVLAQLPNVGSILHTHSIWGTLLSDHFYSEGGFVIRGYEMLKGLEGIVTHASELWVPIFENTQDISQLAEQVQQELSRPNTKLTHGFLIRNHGLYTWGADVASARRHIEVFEFLFEVIGRKTQLS